LGDGDKKSNETEDEVTSQTETNNYLPLKGNSKKMDFIIDISTLENVVGEKENTDLAIFLVVEGRKDSERVLGQPNSERSNPICMNVGGTSIMMDKKGGFHTADREEE
jgi:hypothetical protein